MVSIWGFQERFSLMVNPRKQKLDTRSIGLPLMNSERPGGDTLDLLRWNNMYLVLLEFRESLFTASQSKTLDNSKFTLLISMELLTGRLKVLYNVVSSAYNKKEKAELELGMSFM
jgi:hypothetical protein